MLCKIHKVERLFFQNKLKFAVDPQALSKCIST
jgi:hypothetical protein